MDTDASSVSPSRKILFRTGSSENAGCAFNSAVGSAMRRPGFMLYLLDVIADSEVRVWKMWVYG